MKRETQKYITRKEFEEFKESLVGTPLRHSIEVTNTELQLHKFESKTYEEGYNQAIDDVLHALKSHLDLYKAVPFERYIYKRDALVNFAKVIEDIRRINTN